MDLETPSSPSAQLGFESSLHRTPRPPNRRARRTHCTSPPAPRLLKLSDQLLCRDGTERNRVQF
jgi:hypothetical protein